MKANRSALDFASVVAVALAALVTVGTGVAGSTSLVAVAAAAAGTVGVSAGVESNTTAAGWQALRKRLLISIRRKMAGRKRVMVLCMISLLNWDYFES